MERSKILSAQNGENLSKKQGKKRQIKTKN